jgi:hypothetical protein
MNNVMEFGTQLCWSPFSTGIKVQIPEYVLLFPVINSVVCGAAKRETEELISVVRFRTNLMSIFVPIFRYIYEEMLTRMGPIELKRHIYLIPTSNASTSNRNLEGKFSGSLRYRPR